MRTNGFLKHTLQTGAMATTTSTLALAALGAMKSKDPAGPINAISHLILGDEDAYSFKGIDAKHTLSGAGLNAASVTLWAGLHELLFGKWARQGPLQALTSGAIVSGLAFVTDHQLVPKRFSPGYENKLDKKGLLISYAVLALSFAAAALVTMKDTRPTEEPLEMAPPL